MKKQDWECSQEEFENIPTKYYKKGGYPRGVTQEIVEYISDPNDLIECLGLPHPTFDVQDLSREKRMVPLLRSELSFMSSYL